MSYDEMAGKTATQLREMADRAETAREESFQRSDTDGCVTQWANGISATLYRTQAELTENGGTAEFAALFDTAGTLIAAKRIEGRYGMSWALLASDDPHSRFTGYFNPSKARDAKRRQAADAAKGYQVGLVRAKAKAEIFATGRGLSGAANARVIISRADGGFSRDAEILATADYED